MPAAAAVTWPWRRMMNGKITEQHRSKPACVYIRQSTPGQVRHHQESTQRQYALRQRAMELGWSESAIRILDRDLGHSAQLAGREDFKTLVAEVSAGQGGAVFALEVSRLARSNVAWHRLLQLCALPTPWLSIRTAATTRPTSTMDW